MLNRISYGTYIIFGLLTYLGAAFIWFFVPETKRLTLEEMDIIFGSEGTSQADFERMEEINNAIGLTAMLQHQLQTSSTSPVLPPVTPAPTNALSEAEKTTSTEKDAAKFV